MNRNLCPNCNGDSKLITNIGELSFRKEPFKIIEHYYLCEDCQEEFTDTKIDELNISQVYNQYRVKHSIPFPEDIKKIRQQYGLTYSKMSDVLGLGINSYRNYEKGEMPNQANANLIRMAENPSFFKTLIDENNFSLSKLEDINLKIDFLEKEAMRKKMTQCRKIDVTSKPNEFTGFRSASFNRIKNIILYLISNTNNIYTGRLKLNKLLFYTDFYHFKISAKSMTGLSYRTIKHGPVPSFYDNLYSELIYQNAIEEVFTKSNNSGTYLTLEDADSDMFSKEELKTLNIVVANFKDIKPWDLVEISHEEDFYDHLVKEKRLINYLEYGFKIKAL